MYKWLLYLFLEVIVFTSNGSTFYLWSDPYDTKAGEENGKVQQPLGWTLQISITFIPESG